MSTIYQKGQLIACPHCQKEQEAPVEDLVIPGRVGADSRATTDCEWCFADFSVETLADGRYEVNVE